MSTFFNNIVVLVQPFSMSLFSETEKKKNPPKFVVNQKIPKQWKNLEKEQQSMKGLYFKLYVKFIVTETHMGV